MKTKSNNKRGISLIVLVITIIVMIILAAAVILSLSSSGIIGRANEAVGNMNLAQAQVIASTIWSEGYLDKLRGNDLIKYVKDKLAEQEITEDKFSIEVDDKGVSIGNLLSPGEKYYGDASIVPTKAKYFEFDYNTETLTATIKKVKDEHAIYDYYYWDGKVEKPYISTIKADDGTTITDVVIPYQVEYDGNMYEVIGINENAFYSGYPAATKYTSFVLPNTITSIGHYAFADASSLTSVTIPASVTSIGHYAFGGCSSLTSITIPDSVTSISDHAFYGCSSLTSVTIPASVTSIDYNAFDGCSSLTSITIPDSVTSISGYAFYGCTSLASITIPDSVISIEEWAFGGCTSLTSVTIPDSVISIEQGAFWDCSSLTSITIPDSVTSIGHYAFEGASSLTSVTIPTSVTSISSYAFDGCTSLTSVTFKNPNGWWIGSEASDTSGTAIEVTDASKAATYLTSTYTSYYWFRSDS